MNLRVATLAGIALENVGLETALDEALLPHPLHGLLKLIGFLGGTLTIGRLGGTLAMDLLEAKFTIGLLGGTFTIGFLGGIENLDAKFTIGFLGGMVAIIGLRGGTPTIGFLGGALTIGLLGGTLTAGLLTAALMLRVDITGETLALPHGVHGLPVAGLNPGLLTFLKSIYFTSFRVFIHNPVDFINLYFSKGIRQKQQNVSFYGSSEGTGEKSPEKAWRGQDYSFFRTSRILCSFIKGRNDCRARSQGSRGLQ